MVCLAVAGFALLLQSCSKTADDSQQVALQLAIDTTIIHNYIVANNLTSVVQKDKSSGQYYIIDTLGTGSALYTNSTLVTVGYQGYILGSSTAFAQTDQYHPSYTFGNMIKGWQYGLPHVKKGGTIRLFVPSGYAYGAYEQPLLGLPANAILYFKIKVYDIIN